MLWRETLEQFYAHDRHPRSNYRAEPYTTRVFATQVRITTIFIGESLDKTYRSGTLLKNSMLYIISRKPFCGIRPTSRSRCPKMGISKTEYTDRSVRFIKARPDNAGRRYRRLNQEQSSWIPRMSATRLKLVQTLTSDIAPSKDGRFVEWMTTLPRGAVIN